MWASKELQMRCSCAAMNLRALQADMMKRYKQHAAAFHVAARHALTLRCCAHASPGNIKTMRARLPSCQATLSLCHACHKVQHQSYSAFRMQDIVSSRQSKQSRT